MAGDSESFAPVHRGDESSRKAERRGGFGPVRDFSQRVLSSSTRSPEQRLRGKTQQRKGKSQGIEGLESSSSSLQSGKDRHSCSPSKRLMVATSSVSEVGLLPFQRTASSPHSWPRTVTGVPERSDRPHQESGKELHVPEASTELGRKEGPHRAPIGMIQVLSRRLLPQAHGRKTDKAETRPVRQRSQWLRRYRKRVSPHYHCSESQSQVGRARVPVIETSPACCNRSGPGPPGKPRPYRPGELGNDAKTALNPPVRNLIRPEP